MRPLERKIFQKLPDENISLDSVLELLDRIPRTEMKKSFPDDCHFQSDKYFAKQILQALIRYRLLKRDGSKYRKIKKSKTS